MFKRKGPLSHGITDFKAHDRAFIKIQDGCNNFCSYCIVPYARGRSRSRDPKEILAEAERLIDKGYKELVLTGICLGDFGKDLGSSTGLRGLISSISEIDGDFRIRLSSIELPDVTDDLIDEMASSKKLCNHLHIPLQSGDNEVLKNMNRRYAKEEFVKRIEYIRSRIPDIGITTDIIVGFPSETEEAFRNTIETIKKIRPSRAHIFRYSRRKKTRAFDMADNVSAAIKEARYKQLKELTDKFAEDFKAEAVKKPQRVLLESCRDKETGFLMGYTDTYVKVLLDGPDGLMGRFKNGPVPILVARV
jgi:threonylcarbamoyladenosine tRNA methylthiotransferase MtaB